MTSRRTLWQWLRGVQPVAPAQFADEELPRQAQAQDSFPAPAKEISAHVREARRREARHAQYRAGPWQQK